MTDAPAPTAPHDRHSLHPAPPAIGAGQAPVAPGRIGAAPPSASETVAAREAMARVVPGRR